MAIRIAKAALTAAYAGLVWGFGGCAWGGPPLEEKEADLSAPHVAGTPVDVQGHNGAVRVHAGVGSGVAIHATLRMESVERLEATTVSADRQPDGTLLIRAVPPQGGWRGSEGCGFEVSLPDASRVTATTDNGRIEVDGAGGPVFAKTSNGRIVMNECAGPVSAATSNGRVEVHGAHSAVAASTSNGSVTVELAPDGPGPINASTSNGSVELTLSPAFRGTLAIGTNHGSLRLPDGGDGLTVTRLDKTSATLRAGQGGESSEVRTSNGGITVRRGAAPG